MKSIKVYEEIHRAVKAEAARSDRSVPNVASEILRFGLEALKKGKLSLVIKKETEDAAAK